MVNLKTFRSIIVNRTRMSDVWWAGVHGVAIAILLITPIWTVGVTITNIFRVYTAIATGTGYLPAIIT